jgi:CHAT domain-containing protein
VYEQSLTITREIGDRAGEANTLNNIGIVYESLGNYPEAIAQYEASLAIKREIGDRAGEANTLNNIGIVYESLGKYPEAIAQYEASLAITREIGDRATEAQTLNNIGIVYESLGKYPEAIAQYEASLAITREIGDRAGEANTLGNMGLLFEAQNDPVLAIIFLKQAINIYEAIRDSNQALAQEFQDSYTATIEDNYRTLADLLLQQNRILEAQRVLDLLRVQELDDYLRGVQRNATTEAGVAYWQVEAKLLQLYRELLLAGNELALLRDIPFSELNPEQSDRLDALTAREGELEENFQQWLEHPQVAATLAALRTSTEGRNLEIEDYATLQQNLANLPQNTVLLYPLILDKRLELVLVSPYAPPVRYPVEVEATELNRVITAFGQSLKYARPDVETHAQQLYDWLIKPLEDNLSDAQAEMIIFAPDGVLRYVPLAALHDGDGWLAERFSFTHITAAALTNFAAKPQDNPRLLAAACGECDFEYEVAGQQFRFSLLPYAESEVVRLSEQMPNVDVLPTADFTPEALNLRLGSYEILHLATHGAFVSGQPEESFIVFGDESRLNLTQIEQQ